MLKILKKLIEPFVDWVPVFFCWGLLYLTPSLYIREISLYISQKNFIIIIQILIWLWLIFTTFDNESKPFVWKVISNLVPIELICFVFFLQYHFKAALVIVAFFVVLDFSFLFVLKKDLYTKPLTRKRWHNYKIICKRLSSLLIVLLLTVPSGLCIFIYGLHQPYSVATISKEIFCQTSFESLAIQNEAVLQNLTSAEWGNLSHEEKMDVLQTVVNIEATYLTISPITLKSTKLEDNTVGQYSYDENIIYIDSEFLAISDSADVLDTICHECRHAYQHYVVDMLDWSQDSVNSHYYYRSAQQWKLELNDYRDGQLNYDTYYQQSIEADARAYAERSVYVYMEFLGQD